MHAYQAAPLLHVTCKQAFEHGGRQPDHDVCSKRNKSVSLSLFSPMHDHVHKVLLRETQALQQTPAVLLTALLTAACTPGPAALKSLWQKKSL